MAKAKKLPSGNWRVLVFLGKDAAGKRCYKSFTADNKWEAERQAAEYARIRSFKKTPLDITVYEAIKRYVDAKDGTLKASTIRSYRASQENALKGLHDVTLRDLTNERIQSEISLARTDHAAKTVKNWVGLLTAALNMFHPDFKVSVSIPTGKKREPSVPVDEQIRNLLTLAKGTDIELPIILAAMGSLREGEVAALTPADIAKTGIRVNKTMARDQHGTWIIEEMPKTEAGDRIAPLPKAALSMLKKQASGKKPSDRLFELNPEQIYKHFKRLSRKCGLERCRFHDLRHYYASMAHALGVPDKRIMLNGGWKDKGTLSRIYEHAQKDREDSENKPITDHFSTLLLGE